MKLVFATHNPGKVIEMRAMLAGPAIEVVSAEEAGVTEDVVEDGATFEENAAKKARFVTERTGEWAVSDDSGICIASLGGAPGVHSARWAGEGASGEALVAKTLESMRGVPADQRGAWFESALVLTAPDGRSWAFTGRVSGGIASSPRGTPRPKLPYDVLFIPEGHERTFAEMSDEEKNSLSHRGLAFQKLREFLLHRQYDS